MEPPTDDKNLIALAGEYHVLAQLAERGIVGALTLGHTKGVDILAHNPRTGRILRVEVKTTRRGSSRAQLWHPAAEKVHSWTMGVKHEAMKDRDLIYCFVQLTGHGLQPGIFVVPAKDVARYVRWEHTLYRKSRKNRSPRSQNTMRTFRVDVADPLGYAQNWSLFD